MRFLRLALTVSAAALIAACGSTAQVKQHVEPTTAANAKFTVTAPVNAAPKDGDQPTDAFLASVAGHLRNELSKNGRLAKEGDQTLNIRITVTEYRMRSGFSRAMFGVFAGKDGIASSVEVTDASGKVLGSSSISTFNAMAIGGEEDIARMHGTEIANTLFARLNTAQAAGR